MKRTLLLTILFVIILLQSSAQISGNGYYRIMSRGHYTKSSIRAFAALTYKTAKINTSAGTSQEIEPLALRVDPETSKSDPAAVIYISDPFDVNKCNLIAQGTSVRSIFNGTMVLAGNQPQYTLRGTASGVSAYLYAKDKTYADDGHFIVATSGKEGYQYWSVYPVDNNSSDYYLGIKPTLNANGKYYQPYYASYPFKPESAGMKVYYVSAITNDSYTLKEITGIVPAATPVLVECSSPNSQDNKITIYPPGTKGEATADNKLSGVYFFNPNLDLGTYPDAETKFDATKMRVWNVKDGKLVLSTSDEKLSLDDWDEPYYCLNANQSYLPLTTNPSSYAAVLNNSADKPKHTITFDTDGGSAIAAVQYTEGQSITPPTNPTKTGFDFAGWNPALPSIMPTNDVTVKAQWTPKSYTLTYNVDGTLYKSITLAYGATITPETNPTKIGYTFSGWSDIPAKMPANNVTVNGTFSVKTYNVIYNVDGTLYKTVPVNYGAAITPEAAPTRTGCTFSGWSEIPSTMPANDVIVNGTFSANNYKITYIVDGNEYKSVSVAFGSAITPESAPTKTGYAFSGWSSTPATMPANDITVTGTFSLSNYKITYNVDGVEYKTATLAYGASITPETAPTKTGYTFSGWSEIPATMPASDVTVNGTFTVNTHTITYNVDGVEYKSYVVAYGTTITPETSPTKTGYTFSGWSGVPSTMPDHDVTVNGTFSVNNYKLTYMVDGVEYKSSTLAFGAAISPETAPIKTGYIFSGWSLIPSTMPDHDVVVTGTFTFGTFKITYILDGEEYYVVSKNYGEALTLEAAPKKTGYTFSGWSSIPATMPANDLTVTGSFSVNTYNIIYKVDGEDYKTVGVTYGTTITPETAPTKTGYTFSGWSTIPATMPAHDVTVTGTFSANTYKVTYNVDGALYKSVSVTYGTTITPETAPTKTGHTFSGWSTIPATMPANDITINGSFAVNKYTVTFLSDGNKVKEVTLDYGTAITLPSNPQKTGYTFTGWSPEVDNTVPANDVTYNAMFSINSHKIIYTVDGNVVSENIFVYDTPLTPLTAPTKTGYTFSGWSPTVPATMPDEDVTISGTFSINQYNVTFLADGKTVKSDRLNYNDIIVKPADPQKTGYTFTGWTPSVRNNVPAYDVEYTAQFSVNQYTITFDSDGGSAVADITQDYSTAITAPDHPTKFGYQFKGWTPSLPATMPSDDLALKAQWERANEDYTLQLQAGWNWVSFPQTLSAMHDVTSFLSAGLWSSGDELKNAYYTDSYSSTNNAWVGTLGAHKALANTSMYKLYSAKKQNVVINNLIAEASDVTIPVVQHWNYISYIPQCPLHISEALADYDASIGDILKSQDAYSEYTASGWKGTLTTLQPGEGYMLKRTSAAPTSFRYPTLYYAPSAYPTKAAYSKAAAFSGNMTVTAKVEGIDIQQGDSIIALAGTDVRGVALLEPDGTAFVTVQGDDKATISFALLRDGACVAKANASLSYVDDAVLGSCANPQPIDFAADTNARYGITDTITAIYTLDGKRLGTTRISALPSGTYIIFTGQKSVKLKVED